MMHFERVVPDEVEDGAPVLVLLHGRGSDERDLMELGSMLAPNAIVVTPRAPFPGAPWGYGPGWAWYRFLGGNRPEPESFGASLAALDELIDALPAELPVRPGSILVGGFSQGGTLGMAYLLTHPGRVAGALNFSGFLADHPMVEESLGADPSGRIFWAHGTGDPNIPFSLAISGRSRLAEAGIAVEARDYEIGHWIAPDEVRNAAEWVGGVVDAGHEGARGVKKQPGD